MNTPIEITQALNSLHYLRGIQKSLQDDLNALLEAAKTTAIKTLEARLTELSTETSDLEASIKRAVLFQGVTVRGSHLMATWNKPRITWNGKGLQGYAVAHPEIKEFMRKGKANVSIRKVQKSD